MPFCCGDLIGLALPAFSPSESSPVSETSTIVLLPLCLGRIFPMKTLFLGIFSQNNSSSVQITDFLVSVRIFALSHSQIPTSTLNCINTWIVVASSFLHHVPSSRLHVCFLLVLFHILFLRVVLGTLLDQA